MYTIDKKGFGQSSAAGVMLLALTLTGCANKTAALHPPPYFSVTPTREATNAVDAGDGDMEIANLRRAMVSHPDDVEARLHLAQAYEARGFPDIALEHYRLAAERFPDSVNAAVRLAKALRKADQKEEALAKFHAFLHAHPQTASEPYEWEGILNDDLQNWKASQLAYETALIYSPASAELHNNLGYSLLMQFQHNAAAIEFREALRLQHGLVIARNNLGIALATNPTGNHNDAILNWQAMNGPAAAHNNMAALLIERGDYAGARKELVAALGYDRQNAQAIYNLALVSLKDGKPGVVPPADAVARTSRPSLLSRILHPGRSEKPSVDKPAVDKQAVARPADPKPLSAGQPPVGNGSGN